MNVVITGGPSLLSSALAERLGGAHTVQVAPEGDLRDEAFARKIMEGAYALVHLALAYPGLRPGQSGGASHREVLDLATRGTYVLFNAALAAGVQRIVLGSTLTIMERYPASWRIGESWQPLPDVNDVSQLAAYLAEEGAKQFARVHPLAIVGLRFGQIVDDASVEGKPYDPRWLHVDDAVQAVQKALDVPLKLRNYPDGEAPSQGWWVYHVPGGGAHTRVPLSAAANENGLAYAPTHDFAGHAGADDPPPAGSEAERAGDLSIRGPRERTPSRPVRNVVVFGAGGPLAAATTEELAASYRLRLTDVRDIAEMAAEGKPQSTGAPLPRVLGEPHETVVVDVTDQEQVLRACEGMDAIVNCTVVRPHAVNAFLVNTIGAYNVMRAAVTHGIRRVVHTGPQLVANDRPAGYWWDFEVPDDAPGRPGTSLYGFTKYLGQEIVRLFAEQYDLEVPSLYYSSFVNPRTAKPRQDGVVAMTVSWEDAGRAMRHALEAPSLPSSFEIFHILADLPHGKFSNAKAKRLLGWQPRDSLVELWGRRQ